MQGRERARETWARTLTRSLDVRFGGVRAADQDKYRDPRKEKSNQGSKPIRVTPDSDKEQRKTAQDPSSPVGGPRKGDGRVRQKRKENKDQRRKQTVDQVLMEDMPQNVTRSIPSHARKRRVEPWGT
jgi:hypothetical protein